ncbi:membrane hypothetical protein [Novosphingobium sp. 9U]|nr:membrane hypothetical protein [Novosphingobium sp. 9U]
MSIIGIGQTIRHVLLHTPPIMALLFWTRIAFDDGYNAGWTASQGSRSHAPLGDPTTWIVCSVLSATSLILVAHGKPKIGNALAAILCLLASMIWIAMSR